MKGRNKIVVLALLALIFTSCHKKNDKGVENTGEPEKETSVKVISAADTISFPRWFGEWETLESNINVNLTSPKSFGAGGKLYMRNGEEVLISLRFIGFEVGQLYANSDSVYIVEKYHKWYIAEPLAKIMGGADVSLGDLQGYLLGRPTKQLPAVGGYEAIYGWNAENEELEAVGFMRNGTPVAALGYEGYEWTPTGKTNGRLLMAAVSGNSEYNAELSLSLPQAKWNTLTGRLNFKRPGKDYKRVSLENIVENL